MVAANFERCLELVLDHEGGYVDDPEDSGGATAFGVTIGTAKDAGLDVDGDGDVDKADVRKLTPALVAPVYKARYWSACHCDELPAGLDLMIFDAAVQHGPARARRWLQEAAGAHVDGIIGPLTLRSVRGFKTDVLIARVALRREQLYRAHPKFGRFGKGWLRRLNACRRKARGWAAPGL